ncbi:hypothetical protein ES703_42054 [subsurface metagenome]
MRGKSFSFGEVLGFGWRTMKDNLGFFVGVGIILFLISSLGQIFSYVVQQYSGIISPLFALLLLLVTSIIEIIVAIGLIKITLSFCDERKPRFSTLFDAWGCFWKYLVAGFLYILIMMAPPAACILLLIFPSAATEIPYFVPLFFVMAFILAIALSIKFSLCFYFVVDKGLGPINALKASSRTTMDAKWSLFVFGILCSLINLLGTLCFGIGMFATFPIVMVAMALVYRQLSAQTPGLNEFGIGSPVIQPNPLIHSGLSIRHVPAVHPIPAIQPAPRVQTAPGIEHTLSIQPDTDTQHFIGNQPDADIQHTSGNPPDAGNQPDSDIQHTSGNQPDAGNQHPTGIQHVLGNQPDPAVQSVPRVRPVSVKKKSSFPLLAVILAAVVIMAGIAYYLRPATTKAVPLNKQVALTGILYAGDNSSAVVDGKIVHEQDTINGVKVIKIHKDKVEFEKAGKRWTQQVE